MHPPYNWGPMKHRESPHYERHGYASTSPERRQAIYRIWANMIQRCYNPKRPQFRFWGGRGVRVCDRWRISFKAFLEDMGNRPTNKHSLDRFPNKDGDYEPGNCRWATMAEQNRNSRHNRILTFNGKSQCIADWAAELGVPRYRLTDRLNKLGWSIERTLTTIKSHRWARRAQSSSHTFDPK